jgi:hypothetical protein
VCYSCSLLVVYWGYVLLSYHRTTTHLSSQKASPTPAPAPALHLLSLSHVLPGPLRPCASEDKWVNGRQVWLAVAMSGQGLLKHLLTQGDKIMLSLAHNYYNQVGA